ncbi:hypothetical protein CSOJ01_07829 [Colletotrichum sojae]|uniref:Uncharacterized protein n=1 Tax=Colletotrichum sojae TaxID=2175907 RepID=A0A8H6MT27_9PEZI|nr:hypothetical protein CSOJ01_07829 [Colletotrichum sojae]
MQSGGQAGGIPERGTSWEGAGAGPSTAVVPVDVQGSGNSFQSSPGAGTAAAEHAADAPGVKPTTATSAFEGNREKR